MPDIDSALNEAMQQNEHGKDFWLARDLMRVLVYKDWRNFMNVINKAREACQNSGQSVDNHFVDITKMVNIGSGAHRSQPDVLLSRYACYLVAQNGDSSNPKIAAAQTYFAIQTRKQEIFEEMSEDHKRLHIRDQEKDHNKKLVGTAIQSGVTDYAQFQNMGYLGLYNHTADDLRKIKKIGDDHLLDRAGSTELAANLFRITQTEEKLRIDQVSNQGMANITHMRVGQEVRKAIENIGGTMPEDLPPEEHIKSIEKRIKEDGKKLISADKPSETKPNLDTTTEALGDDLD